MKELLNILKSNAIIIKLKGPKTTYIRVAAICGEKIFCPLSYIYIVLNVDYGLLGFALDCSEGEWSAKRYTLLRSLIVPSSSAM